MMKVNFELIHEDGQNLEIFKFWCSACDARPVCEGMVWLIWRISLHWLLISSWFPSNDQIFLIEWYNPHDLPQGPQWYRLAAFLPAIMILVSFLGSITWKLSEVSKFSLFFLNISTTSLDIFHPTPLSTTSGPLPTHQLIKSALSLKMRYDEHLVDNFIFISVGFSNYCYIQLVKPMYMWIHI